MTENKRFTTNGYYIYDHFKGDKWLVNEVEAQEIVDKMNNLDTKARERSKALSKLQKENEQLKKDCTALIYHNQDYRKENEQLKKELHLMHIKTMFSTIQSFKGNVSKRYRYSKETDTIYDTANHYGQYDKILDKAEIVMLLNEYETVLNELNGDIK